VTFANWRKSKNIAIAFADRLEHEFSNHEKTNAAFFYRDRCRDSQLMRVEPAGEFDNNDDDNHNSPTRHGASIANDGAARHVTSRQQRSQVRDQKSGLRGEAIRPRRIFISLRQ
jgi:hypothetical protein